MIYWPGTNIIKSQGNAFTSWKEGRPSLADNRSWHQSVIGKRNVTHSKTYQITIKPKK